MTCFPTYVARRCFYLYLIPDIYRRKIVGWEVHETDDADYVARVVQRAALTGGVAADHTNTLLHGNNGATLKPTTVLAMPHWLGINPPDTSQTTGGQRQHFCGIGFENRQLPI